MERAVSAGCLECRQCRVVRRTPRRDSGSLATAPSAGALVTDTTFAKFDPDSEQAVGIMTPAELASAQARLWRGGFAPGVHDAEIRALDELIYGPKPAAAEADGGAEPE